MMGVLVLKAAVLVMMRGPVLLGERPRWLCGVIDVPGCYKQIVLAGTKGLDELEVLEV